MSVLMVVRTGFAGTSDATFGPFKTYEEAEEFTRSPVGGSIYNATAGRPAASFPAWKREAYEAEAERYRDLAERNLL